MHCLEEEMLLKKVDRILDSLRIDYSDLVIPSGVFNITWGEGVLLFSGSYCDCFDKIQSYSPHFKGSLTMVPAGKPEKKPVEKSMSLLT